MTLNVQPAPEATPHHSPQPLINDFSIVAATVNGSGSQTANLTLIRALFRMGIPVNGKNLFPSNISGLPTWFTIRASKDGYVARRDEYEILVAMNPATQAEDIEKLSVGGLCLYPSDWKIKQTRTDIAYYPLPTVALAKAATPDPKLRDYMANMVYVGALAELLGIEMAEIENALKQQLKNKAKAVALNMGVVQAGAEHVRSTFPSVTPADRHFQVQRMNGTTGKIMIEGNAAAALGSIFGGVSVAAWYPITPSTSVIDNLTAYAKDLRTDPTTGETTVAILQAEDELAAIGMVIGAGWAGARAMTATSGPGISLMTEFSGMGYFTEVPAVIWDIQRMGPSTGLPTRVSQGDVLKVYFLGHGDTRQICLLPGNMRECFDFGIVALDLADQLQTPVFVLSDLDLGMNLWMSEPFEYPETPINRGKVLNADDLKRLGGFARYKDVDGDGVGYRTLPGTNHPLAAYFARGTGHDESAGYSERPEVWEANLNRLAHKHDTARTLVPGPVIDTMPDATIGLISYGSNDPGIVEARAILTAQGHKTDYLRIRALPLTESIHEFVAQHAHIYVIENNHDGQMAELLQLDMPPLAGKIVSLAHCDGLPLTAKWIADAVLEQEH